MVHRHLTNPVEKLAKEVQNQMVKTAEIHSDLGHSARDSDDTHTEYASTSAHDVGDVASEKPHHHPHHRRTKSARQSAESGNSKSSRKLPQLAPAASRRNNSADEDEDEDFDAHGFDHPSTYEEQPWIWVPRDELGLSAYFVEEFRALGVEASDEGATMDEKGNVEVNRSPPDEDWSGGHDA